MATFHWDVVACFIWNVPATSLGCTCVSAGSVINQNWSMQSLVTKFFPAAFVWFMGNLMCLCEILKCRSYLNANVSVSSIFRNVQFFLKYHFLCHRNFPLEEIHLSVNCYISIFILIRENTKNFTVLCICNILEQHPKAHLNISLNDMDQRATSKQKQLTSSIF